MKRLPLWICALVAISFNTALAQVKAVQVVWSVAWSASGTYIAFNQAEVRCTAESFYSNVYLYNVDEGAIVNMLSEHVCPVTNIYWANNDAVLVTSGNDALAVVWLMPSGREIATQYIPSMEPYRFVDAVSPDGRFAVNVIYSSVDLLIWDIQTGATVATFPKLYTLAADWSPDSQRLVVGGNRPGVIDATTGELLVEFQGARPFGEAIWSPDGEVIAAWSYNQDITVVNLELWDANTGQRRWTTSQPADRINRMRWSRDGQYFATASQNGTVQVWERQTGQVVGTIQRTEAVNSVDWNPDGTQLVLGGVLSPDASIPGFEIVPAPIGDWDNGTGEEDPPPRATSAPG